MAKRPTKPIDLTRDFPGQTLIQRLVESTRPQLEEIAKRELVRLEKEAKSKDPNIRRQAEQMLPEFRRIVGRTQNAQKRAEN